MAVGFKVKFYWYQIGHGDSSLLRALPKLLLKKFLCAL